MRLILFGAGASFGCERASPYCPPRGAELFDDLQKQYPDAWGKLPKSWRMKFVPNFEPGMKELWDSGSHDVSALMRCMADYFARFRPLPGSAYHRLLEHLNSLGTLRGTYFSTLNYDCLLEYAGRQFRHNIQYFSPDPTNGVGLTVWKIHGSCNFLPASVSGSASGVTYAASHVKWDGKIRIVDASQVAPFVAKSAFYPAMAVFMEGKPVHSHQSRIKELQSSWADAVLRADAVGIIGVRPNEADTHIWQPLAKTDAELVVIGNRKEYQAWAKARRTGKSTSVVGNKFAPDLPAFAEAFSS